MPTLSRPAKTAKVTVELPEFLPDIKEDDSPPFIAVEVEVRTSENPGKRFVTGVAMSVLLHAARGLHMEMGGDPADLPGGDDDDEAPTAPGRH